MATPVRQPADVVVHLNGLVGRYGSLGQVESAPEAPSEGSAQPAAVAGPHYWSEAEHRWVSLKSPDSGG